MNKTDRLGEKRLNKLGLVMEIVEYKNFKDILVKFENTGYITNTRYSRFKDGYVKDVCTPSIFNIGFIGEGKYKSKENGKTTNAYKTWNSMIKRCYGENQLKLRSTYKICSVYEDWHNFQNYAQWYDENYYEIEGERIELDKDILIKGNKMYSPDTCIFVPQRINGLILNRGMDRGNFPIGVHLNKKHGKYLAQCSIGKGKIKHLGRHSDVNEAFLAYKTFKESLIKEVAEEYKDKIPDKLYNAMLAYEVEITD